MLLFDKVTKKYDKNITAVEDISFKADKGEFIFLVGPSGAGKSTLMRLLIREELPTTGSIFFDEIEIPKLPRKLLPTYRQRLGIVFQDMKLIEGKTLGENIDFALEILGKPEKEIKDTTHYLLDLVGLEDRIDLFPKQLSGGEQQRGAIARALANSPELLVADEPTGNLDYENAMHILSILDKINKTGTSVMVISHDRDIVNKQKARVLRMDKGKLISDTNGNYDDIKKPKDSSPEKIVIKDESKKEETKKTEDELKGLNKKIVTKLEKLKITTMDMILNLTDSDLKKAKLTKKEKSELESFIKNYLSKK
jgi:cell division transport system ATP-binding protein